MVVRQAADGGLVHRAEGLRSGPDQGVGVAPDVAAGPGHAAVPRRRAASSGSSATPGPPNAKASEAYSKYIIIDMYAKAIQGMSAEDAAKWAEGELRKIYG